MIKSEKQQAMSAEAFAQRWEGRGYEKGDSQLFWTELLTEVFGVERPSEFVRFEEQVKVDKTNFIDCHIPTTRVLIEQKSLGKDLRKGIVQSDGSVLNPFQQAKRYVANMPLSEHPRWIVTCNFSDFLVYDMEQPNGEPEHIALKNLGKEYYRLQFLVNVKSEHLKKEMEVSMQAGEIVGKIYDALLEQYDDSSSEALRWLNILCVRIVFCLYAEDAGVFRHDQFHDFLSSFEARDLRRALNDLFEVLNTPVDKRSRYMMDDLKAFPYTNGGLFAEHIEIPQFTDEIREILLQNASLDFDWSEISPTIFGAVFESTLNPATRRSGGMHYTSIENIHKVIDPLFLTDLRRELDVILEEKVERQRNLRLDSFQKKLASLTFLDPACGSGNFLTETYLSLRRMENEVIRERWHGQSFIGFDEIDPIKVSIHQFHGIEINDFAVTVATTALWISEAQMLRETEKIVKRDISYLPLKSYSNIREGNALRMDWDIIERESDIPTIHATKVHLIQDDKMSVVSDPTFDEVNVVATHFDNAKPEKQRYAVTFDYIMGNPPFVGARMMSTEQKADIKRIFGARHKNVGNMDYVCCWYKKSWKIVKYSPTPTHVALVSTNSICQGEQVANLWQPLMEEGLRIDFAHRTFRWNSEAKSKAHVHCIVVGFSKDDGTVSSRQIFDNGKVISAEKINAYLMDAPNVFVSSRQRPIADVPEIGIGNKPIDGGNYLLEKEEMEEFIRIEPQSAPYFHEWYGAYEFIHQQPRYCLWLGDCTPGQLHKMPHCLQRVRNVRNQRLESKSAGTRKMADTPTRFHVENMPEGDSIIIPRVSSERRRYIPMGFLEKGVFASDAVHLIPNATLYHFGVLESNVHMAWVRAVCGRLKSDYRYSKDIVYNNFPWPEVTPEQQRLIAATAQGILDARSLYPDSSLADLYDELTMPSELRKAHQQNDRAVMEAYHLDVRTTTESQCVARLFQIYEEQTKSN